MATSLGGVTAWMLAIGLGFAAVDWIAVARSVRCLEYFAKPATMVAYIGAALLLSRSAGCGHLAGWFLVALVLCLAGDVCLMLPSDRGFLLGLLAFLLGHICYIIGLNPTLPPVASVAPAVGVAAATTVFLPRILAAMRERGARALRGPAIVYGVALSTMLASASATWFRATWSGMGRVLVSLGGALFYASDAMLTWEMFVQSSRALKLAVIITYHVGQLALVLTVGAQLG